MGSVFVRLSALVVLLLVSISSLAAQTAAPGGASGAVARNDHPIAVPSAHAVRRSSPIEIDGRLDDAAWNDAPPVTEFTQWDPEEGKPATQRTEIRFMFDDASLYVGARMWDSLGVAGVRTSKVRRDANFNSDYLEIVIDGYHDHLSRAFFQVNPSGSKSDFIGIGTSCCDSGWDPIWDAATTITAEGWTAEIRIPLNQLRFPSDSVQTWGLQLRRFINRRAELQQWAFWRKNESGGPGRFGHLDGLELAGGRRHVELMPYGAGSVRNVAAQPGDPFHTGNQGVGRAGVDLKYLLTSSLTLDASINPDFGQVEVDPAVVNLSAFETSFPEKRPFFVASSGVFSYGGFGCFFCSNTSSLSAFYTRRIGRSPTGASLATSAGKYADVPDASTILGAAKITGRTRSGYTVGLLNAVTSKERAPIQMADGSRSSRDVEPFTNYFVGRLKKDLLGGNLTIGGIATSVVRDLDSAFVPLLNKHGEMLGTDFQYTWKNRAYLINGNFAASNIVADRAVILARQRSSARYYQRPLADGTNRLDTLATSMRGAAWYLRASKQSGNWLWEAAMSARTPGFENNDLALLTRADYYWHNANIFRQWTKPTKVYRQLSFIVGGQEAWNSQGELTDRQAQVWGNLQLRNFWGASTFYIWKPALKDDRLLRGGPTVIKPGTGLYSFDWSSDGRKRVSAFGGFSYSWNTANGWGVGTYLNVSARPATNFNFSFGPSWNDSRAILQYVRPVTDPTATGFYGTRHVLAGLRQKTLALDTRFSLTLSPTITFELYAQPFFASGQFVDYKEFDAPGSARFSTYGVDKGTVTATRDSTGLVATYAVDPDGPGPAASFSFQNPDFSLASLRGNAVFRWEFKPGSVLYLAWTHNRSDSGKFGDFRFSREVNGLLDARGDNILLVKVVWWLAI